MSSSDDRCSETDLHNAAQTLKEEPTETAETSKTGVRNLRC